MPDDNGRPTPEEVEEEQRLEAERQEEAEVKRKEEEAKGGKDFRIDPETQEPYTAEKLKAIEAEEKSEQAKTVEAARKRNEENARRRIDSDKQKLRRDLEVANTRIADLERGRGGGGGFFGGRGVVKDDAYWERKMQENPVTAMKEYEEHMWNQRMNRIASENRAAETQGEIATVLKDSQDFVLGKYPELEDENSEKSQLFLSILEKHPTWRSSPVGPIRVMQEMEKVMEAGGGAAGGTTIAKARAEGAAAENARIARTGAQPLPGGRAGNQPKTITLTREQLDYCKQVNIKPEDYAKNLARMSSGEGKVEL